jgi:predicted transcriptional regulator
VDTPIRRLRMEDELWHAAERVAQEQDRSASWIIRTALEEYIERHRAEKRAAKQAAFDAELDKPNRKAKTRSDR